ncbi:ead/Ea22-like family protein [Escherichia coli]
MSNIDKRALRHSAESIIGILENIAGFEPSDIDGDSVELRFETEDGFDTGCDVSIVDQCQKTADVVRALLDELERNQQYIKRRDQENEDIALTVGKLRVELETAKSKLNEQREYYEGVLSDGSKRIAELEKSEEQLINERDHAESALADMYFAATGDRPEWSNWFGFSDAVDAVVDRIADLEAKQPSPVVPEGLVKAVCFYEQVKRENPPVETGAWKDAVDWVLKEACQAVNIGIKGE